jgi:hypothetical protein
MTTRRCASCGIELEEGKSGCNFVETDFFCDICYVEKINILLIELEKYTPRSKTYQAEKIDEFENQFTVWRRGKDIN